MDVLHLWHNKSSKNLFYYNKMNIKKTIILKIAAIMLLFSFISINAYAQDEISTDQALITAGQAIFEENCTACHAINAKVVGPALKDSHKRNNVAWLKAFILNSQKVIQSGDDYAVKIYKEYGNVQMNSHDFSDDELNSLISYIKFASENDAPKEIVASTESNTLSNSNNNNNTDGGDTNLVLLIVTISVLIILLFVMIILVRILKSIASKKEDLTPEDVDLVNQKFDINAVLKSGLFKFIVTLVIIVVLGNYGIDFVYGIGIQQGYAPKQPIEFSHRIHAGSQADGGHEIDCNYCHTGVRKGKSANIPSANVCMNCHSEIKKDSEKLVPLYEAIKNQTPIEWIRIHNLPDLAYFNHAQHVKVGNIDCQKCHGPIETMDVVAQQEDLTMGWCINCHRETEVNAKGNAYYDELLKLHNKKSDKPMTVEDIGGMECAKCHY